MSMVIKRIHTNLALMSLGHKHTFDSKDHKISYNTQYSMFQIDGTLIPVSSIREVLTEGIDKDSPASTHQADLKSGIKEPLMSPAHHRAESTQIVSQPEIVDNWYVSVPDKISKEIKGSKPKGKRALLGG